MNFLNPHYKLIFVAVFVIAFLFFFMLKFVQNEKENLNDDRQIEDLKTIDENTSSETISNINSNINSIEKSVKEKNKKKTEQMTLSKRKDDTKNEEVKKTKNKENLNKKNLITKDIVFDDPRLTVNELHKGLKEINFNNRINSLNQMKVLVKRTYNTRKMTAMIIGKNWKNIKNEKKTELITVMEEYIASNYISRFSKISKVNFNNHNVRKIQKDFKIVNTELKINNDIVNIDYLLFNTDGEWKIFDVLLDNSVSEVATKKSEFNNFISGQNIDKLINAIKKKNTQLKSE